MTFGGGGGEGRAAAEGDLAGKFNSRYLSELAKNKKAISLSEWHSVTCS